MSLGLYKAQRMVRVSDPRLDFDEMGIQVISDSATQIIYNKFPAANPTGNLIKFNTTQTPTQAVSTKMFIECRFRVTITGDNDAGNLYRKGFDAPRFMPLHSITSSAKIEINGASNDIYPDQIVDALMRYNNTITELGQDLSTFPSFLDCYQQYNDAFVAPGGGLGFGTGCNALGQIGEAGPAYEPRGGWVLDSFAENDGQVVLEFTTFEPVTISPLVWSSKNQKSLFGVKNLNITYNLSPDLSRVWSRNEEGGIEAAGITAQIVGVPILNLITLTPKIIDKINPVQIYPWAQIQPYSQNLGTIPAGATRAVTFNAQQLGGVPRRIYIYAKKTNKTYLDTDTFARLDNLAIRFDGVAGIFANAAPQQLFQVCAENGYRGSYQDWYSYAGGVMALDFTKDIPMMDSMSVGTNKNINFQFTCNITNLKSVNTDYTIYTMIVYEGIFSLDQFGTPLFQLNTLSASDLLDAQAVQCVPYNSIDSFALGGSFSSKLSTLGSFAKQLGRKAIGAYESLSDENKKALGNAVTDAATLVSPALSKAITDFGPAAYERAKALVGMGYSENQIYELLSGAGMKKKKATGGKKLTKAELMRIVQG
jgi:hypothetical protein